MVVAHLYVIRHGETEQNRDGIIQGPRIDGLLSEAGALQAERLGEAFCATPLDALYVSPMLRARQTAQAIADRGPRSTAVQVVPELYEMDFGDLCGQHIDAVRPVMERCHDAWALGFTDRPFPGGESPVLVQHRLRTFVHRLREASGHVGIVAHGRLNRILIATLLSLPLPEMARFRQSNAGITHLADPGPTLHRLDDVTHLA